MKVLLPFCAFAVLAASAMESSVFTVAARGKSADCAVVLPIGATEANRTAARELVEGVKRLTGVELPVAAADAAPRTARRIVLRRDPSAAESAFTIEAKKGELCISGDDRGVC